jgi:hypothetical protein
MIDFTLATMGADELAMWDMSRGFGLQQRRVVVEVQGVVRPADGRGFRPRERQSGSTSWPARATRGAGRSGPKPLVTLGTPSSAATM